MARVWKLICLMLLSSAALAQRVGPGGGGGAIPFSGVPSGSCGATSIAVNTLTGDFYACNGGAWLKVGPGAAGSAQWNTLIAPSGNQSISMLHFTSLWTYDATTGAATNVFTITDTASNTGTGHLLTVNTAASSAAKPILFAAQGTSNGVEMDSTGFLKPIGTAGILLRSLAGATSSQNGDQAYDTTAKNWHIFGNGVDNINVVVPVASLPTNGNCAQWVVTAGVYTLGQAAAACGSGGGGVSSFTGDGTVLSNSGSTGTVTATLANAASGAFLGNTGTSAAAPGYHPLTTINSQTTTYTVTLADFAAYKTIVVPSGTFTITLVSNTTQPPSGQFIRVINYGSGQVLLAPNGQNLNGATNNYALAALNLISGIPSEAVVYSDGTNYIAQLLTGASTSINGQNCNLATGTCNVNQGAATHSVALNEGSLAPLSGLTLGAGQVPVGVASSDPVAAAVPLTCGDSSGSGTVQVCNTSPSFTPAAGTAIVYTTTTANTGALTLNVNSLGAKSVVKWQGSALVANDILANKQTILIYDGTNWEAQDIGNSASGFANPMTTLGDTIYENVTPAPARLAGPTTPNSVPQFYTNTPSGGAAQTPAWALAGVPTNPSSCPSNLYTFAATDRASYVSFNDASACAITLPQAGTAGFGSNFVTVACNIGAGTATITPTTSNISYSTGSAYSSAQTSLALTTGQCAWIYSDNTNYFAIVRSGGGISNGHSVAAVLTCPDSSGSGTAQVCNTSPTFTPATGDAIVYTTTSANTGALTVNVNSLGAKSVVKWQNTALVANDVLASKQTLLIYDGTNWEAQDIGNAPAGGASGTPLLNTNLSRWILPIRSGQTTNLGEQPGFTGGSSGDGPASTTNPVYDDINISTAFTASCATGCAGFSGAALYVTGVSGTVYQFQANFNTNISTNHGRYYIGLCGGCGGSANPVLSQALPNGQAGVYIRWSTTDSDTNPICVTSDGATAHTYVPSPTITPAQLNKFEFDDNGTSWTIKVNGTAVCSAMATNIPASNTSIAFIDGVTPATANAIHTFFYGYQEVGQ